MTKICSKCFCEKSLSEFRLQSRKAGKLHPHCSLCGRIYANQRYPRVAEKMRERSRQLWAQGTRIPTEKRRIYGQRYRKKNPEKTLAWGRQQREKDRDKIRERDRRRYEKNPKYFVDYIKRRYHADPAFHVCCLQRSRMNKLLRRIKKSARTNELLGTTAEGVKQYLEVNFRPGMSWDNHGIGPGRWQVDHIRPCCSFPDLTDPNQQAECFHYTNLQPLWHEDHIKKGTKWPTVD